MKGYNDPATGTNMLQASHYDPQNGQMKTVSQFLTSPQPIVPMQEAYAPMPEYMVAGTPYPATPGAQVTHYDRSNAPGMSLRTLFNRAFGSIAR